MMIVKATTESEKGGLPDPEMMACMGRYNKELADAGVLRDLNGLQPSSKGARVEFRGNEKVLVDGPFPEIKELIAGYWLIEVASRQEALDWAMKVPHPHPGTDTHVEIRQVFQPSDFPDAPDEAFEIGRQLQADKA